MADLTSNAKRLVSTPRAQNAARNGLNEAPRKNRTPGQRDDKDYCPGGIDVVVKVLGRIMNVGVAIGLTVSPMVAVAVTKVNPLAGRLM